MGWYIVYTMEFTTTYVDGHGSSTTQWLQTTVAMRCTVGPNSKIPPKISLQIREID